jgi:hypothetical protein
MSMVQLGTRRSTAAVALAEAVRAPVVTRVPAGRPGNQALQRLLHARALQARLRVSAPDDTFEREAERVADALTGAPVAGSAPAAQVQRKCAACTQDDDERLDRRPLRNASGAAGPNAERSLAGLRGGGQPLAQAARAFFEPRLGHDLGAVRIHDDAATHRLAGALEARAFTSGRDIGFAPGEHAPHRPAGRWLLAHELAHVVQQGAARASGVVQRLVRRSLVTGTPAQNPSGADRRAASLLNRAVERIDAALAARATDPAHADVVAVGQAMRRAFALNPSNDANWTAVAPRFGLHVIRRRLEMARDYINSVVFNYTSCAVGGACPGSTCGTCAGEEAFVCTGDRARIQVCPPFWAVGLNQRGRTLAHEVLHVNFGFIDDWGQPDAANAHCYAQFAALLNGFNSPPGFRCH